MVGFPPLLITLLLPSSQSISIKPKRYPVSIYQKLPFRKTVSKLYLIMRISTLPMIWAVKLSNVFLEEFMFKWTMITLLSLRLQILWRLCTLSKYCPPLIHPFLKMRSFCCRGNRFIMPSWKLFCKSCTSFIWIQL